MAVDWHLKLAEVLDPKEAYHPIGEISIGNMVFDELTNIRYNPKKGVISFKEFYTKKMVISLHFLTAREIRNMLKYIINRDTLEFPAKKTKDHE